MINSNRAEDNEDLPEPPADSILALGKKVSDTVGIRLVGVDIIADNLTLDLEESGGRVIEVNTPPGHFYHELRRGGGYPVAVRLLQVAFEEDEFDLPLVRARSHALGS